MPDEGEMRCNHKVRQLISPKTGVVKKRHAVRFNALDVKLS